MKVAVVFYSLHGSTKVAAEVVERVVRRYLNWRKSKREVIRRLHLFMLVFRLRLAKRANSKIITLKRWKGTKKYILVPQYGQAKQFPQ